MAAAGALVAPVAVVAAADALLVVEVVAVVAAHVERALAMAALRTTRLCAHPILGSRQAAAQLDVCAAVLLLAHVATARVTSSPTKAA